MTIHDELISLHARMDEEVIDADSRLLANVFLSVFVLCFTIIQDRGVLHELRRAFLSTGVFPEDENLLLLMYSRPEGR